MKDWTRGTMSETGFLDDMYKVIADVMADRLQRTHQDE